MNQPRKSAFTGQNPITTPPQKTLPTDNTTKRFTVRLPADLIEKIRTASVLYGIPEGIRGPSAWVEKILTKEINRLEKEAGHELDKLPAGVIPTGWSARNPKE